MGIQGRILEALTELGDQYYTRPLGNPDGDPIYNMKVDEEMSITLRRAYEKYTAKWLEKARKIAIEDGYPICTITDTEEGHVKISFLAELKE